MCNIINHMLKERFKSIEEETYFQNHTHTRLQNGKCFLRRLRLKVYVVSVTTRNTSAKINNH